MMGIALDKIVFLPFGKLMDDFRWALFDGTITSNDLNAQWWKRRYLFSHMSLLQLFYLSIKIVR